MAAGRLHTPAIPPDEDTSAGESTQRMPSTNPYETAKDLLKVFPLFQVGGKP